MEETLELDVVNPLYQAIEYNGKLYFTSHYFHQQYKSNAGEKHNDLKNFNRLIRSIETYEKYVESGDIVELEWSDVKGTGSNIELLIKSNSYKQLMLISATAQVALTHHLDDEVSKQASVAINTVASEKMLDHMSAQARIDFEAYNAVAKCIGLDVNAAAIAANNVIVKKHGINLLKDLDIKLIAAKQEQLYTVTEISKQLDIPLKTVNPTLVACGLQTQHRDVSGSLKYELTDDGKEYGKYLDTGKKCNDGTPVIQIKWYEGVIGYLKNYFSKA